MPVSPPRFSREDRVLLECARAEISGQLGLPELLPGVNGGRLLKKARFHGMIPLLYWNLRQSRRGLIAQDVFSEIARRFAENARYNLLLAGKMLEILDLLAAEGIAAVAYKGPTLAMLAYGNLSLRQFSDLDFLVRRQDAVAAKEILLKRGYRPEYTVPPGREKLFIKNLYEFLFSHPDGYLTEIHWRFVPGYYSPPADFEDLTGRLVKVTVGGREILTFSPEDLLLVLCVQNAKHGWERLESVCDVARLIRVFPEMDWERVWRQAIAWRARRKLLLGVALAHRLLGAPIPPSVIKRMEADSVVRPVESEVESEIFSREQIDITSFKRLRFNLKLQDGVAAKAGLLFGLSFAETPEDWKQISLPSWLSFLYFPLRGFRLFQKYAWKRSAG